MKNASASGFLKSQVLPSLLPLPASFFKLFPLPLSHSCPMFYEKCFRFLKKSNASEFASASSFFLQSASASTKKLTASASTSLYAGNAFFHCVILNIK